MIYKGKPENSGWKIKWFALSHPVCRLDYQPREGRKSSLSRLGSFRIYAVICGDSSFLSTLFSLFS